MKKNDQELLAIDFDARWKLATGAIYRAELSHELQQLGFQIEPAMNKSFSINLIPQDLCNAFSKRRTAILEQAEKHGVTSAQGMQIATFATRENKTGEMLEFDLKEVEFVI